ncbi:MAG TPA: hypothetical protein VKP30_11420 [Polyangiaceae bacterium]|nr:hypothetical protein [Polyangiaceae bacterium]
MPRTRPAAHTTATNWEHARSQVDERALSASQAERSPGEGSLSNEAEPDDVLGDDSDAEPIETGYADLDRVVSDPTERSTLGGPGASLAPEEMGQQALSEAAQQNSGDEAAQRGRLDSDEFFGDDDEPQRRSGEPRELDLTDNVVREESLFDIPLEDGSIRAPRLKTNEVDAGLDRDARARRSTDRSSRPVRKSPARSR